VPMINPRSPYLNSHKLLLTVILLSITHPLSAVRPIAVQKGDPLPESYRWQQFPELAGRNILCLAEGLNHDVWFGTAGEGVLRHDGMRCINMGLAGSPVRQLVVAKSKALLAATDQGIFRYEKGGWNRVFPEKEGRCWLVRTLLETPDDALWAGTAWGAVMIKDGQTTLYTSSDVAALFEKTQEVGACVQVPEWCSMKRPWTEGLGMELAADAFTPENVLVRLVKDKSPAQGMGIKSGDCIALKNRDLHFTGGESVEPFRKGDTLVVKRQGMGGMKEIPLTVNDEEQKGAYSLFPVTQLFLDRSGSLWFGLGEGSEGMVVRFAASLAGWRSYSSGTCPTIGGGKSGKRMVQDETGKIWLASEAGISRFNGQAWEPVRFEGLFRGFSILKTADNAVWVGGTSELYRYASGTWTSYRPPGVPLPDRPIFLTETSDGALWMAGVTGEVVRLDYETTRWTIYQGLNFQCETPDKSQWFLSADGRVVRYSGSRWVDFGVEDGLMKTTHRLLATRAGDCWAVGSNGLTTSLAMFNGNRFLATSDARLKGDPVSLVLFEARDGALWTGASWPSESGPPAGAWGAARFMPAPGSRHLGQWTFFPAPDAPSSVSGIGQSRDGSLWFGGERLYQFDGRAWRIVERPEAAGGAVLDMFTSSDSTLFIGMRSNGLAVYDGKRWKAFSKQDGMADDKITSVLKTRDGTLWAATEKGISRFEHTAWISSGLPKGFRIYRRGFSSWGSLKQSGDGALWINQESRTIRFFPSSYPPETEILSDFERVPRQGNAFIQWIGIDMWHTTPSDEMQFSYRLDGGPWSPFSPERQQEFLGLKSGRHSLDVRTRNMDFNVEPTHASFGFAVEPPVYKEWWFILLFSALAGSVLFEAAAILRRNRTLRRANRDLMEQTRQLQQARDDISQKAETLERYNQELQTFAFVASHDLQEPLRLISNYVSLLALRYQNKLDADANEFIGFTIEGARRAQQLINDLLFYFKISIDEKTMRGVSTGTVLKRVLRNLKPVLDANEAAVTSDPLPDVTGDEKQLEALLQNLVANAVKYRRKNAAPRIHVSTSDEEGVWHFTVQDNGIGIAKEYHERIFILFQRLHTREEYSGTGIGLAVCRKIVERHGGKIWVESEPDRGSIFHFTLLKPKRSQA
jgi:signal transduction histidine kinase/ligand-binding sensor domain-containing protein